MHDKAIAIEEAATPKPMNKDIDPSIDYLQEDTIFSPQMEAQNPAPITFDDDADKSIRAGKNNNENLLNDLESILSKHSVEVKKAYTPNIDITDSKEEKKDIKFKKISLFDDEE